MRMALRKPIVTIMGHVDHGKTQLLDTIRHTSVLEREAGAITQAIGASIVPIKTINRICGELLAKLKLEITFPGLLFIDTPGHAAFSNLRRRGGNLADIAIVVIDINEGIKPQTAEAIEILKKYKTPFIVCANKIDLLPGWNSRKELGLVLDINSQSDEVKQLVDTKIYELVGKLHEMGFGSERFDRVSNFTTQISILPISAKTAEGIPEVLMTITGLAQRFLNKCLECDTEGKGKGTILEVKEEKGLGKTIDVIIYNGKVRTGDTIVIGTLGEPVVTKVKAMFEPQEMAEMRDKKSKFCSIKEATAATGVKISAPGMEEVVAGMPLSVVDPSNLQNVKEEIKQEIEEVLIETEKEGIIIKADSLGSLEALITLLSEKEIPIRKASIGNIMKKDVIDCESNLESGPLMAVILGFNVKPSTDASEALEKSGAKALHNDVIYKLLEDFEKWQEEKRKELEAKELETLRRPCKFRIMPNYVFRQSNPAICGVEIVSGKISTGTEIMRGGVNVGRVKSIQKDKEEIGTAEAGAQVAMSIEGPTIGRQIHEGDELYTWIIESEFRKLRDLKKFLTNDEIEILKEIAEIMRKGNSLWGI
jgi:translation initiation factor 5B